MRDQNTPSMNVYFNEITLVPILTDAEENQLAKRVAAGDRAAREQMICANLRFVVKIAKKYAGCGLAIEDLIAEGNIGLMRAVDRFKPDDGCKLTTYAVYWIKCFIRRALARQSKTIRLPEHALEKLARLRKIATTLAGDLGREPTDEELAEEMGLSRPKLAMLREAEQRTVSLDAPVGEDGTATLGDLMGDAGTNNPAETAATNSLHAELREQIAKLSERERRIIRERFGFADGKERTLEQVAVQFGLTRERIRQVQNQALRKIQAGLEAGERGATGQSKCVSRQSAPHSNRLSPSLGSLQHAALS